MDAGGHEVPGGHENLSGFFRPLPSSITLSSAYKQNTWKFI